MSVTTFDQPTADRQPPRTTSKAVPWFAMAAVILSVVAAPVAQAMPFAPDVSITGSLSFFEDSFAFGDASQNGTLTVTAGGSNTSTTYSNTTVTAGTNPLEAALTEIGDGFSFIGGASATTIEDEFLGGIDLLLALANLSATDTYRIALGIDFLHTVDADGDDAFVESVFDLFGSGTSLFTEIISDTFFGDENSSGDLASSGAEVSESGFADPLILELAPGASIDLMGFFTLDGGLFSEGNLTGSFDFDFSVQAVSLVSAPTDVPLPGTALLLGAGLLGFAVANRKRVRSRTATSC